MGGIIMQLEPENSKIGVLIVNLGTPDEPTPQAVKKYLAEFLSDPRVIELPMLLWQVILKGIILNVRPKKSAIKYQSIWMQGGSPLLNISNAQVQALSQRLPQDKYHIILAMRYGNPAIKAAIEQFQTQQISKIIVLPLYPQYCAATTASAFDKIAQVMFKQRYLPALHFIPEYYKNPLYIKALADKITQAINLNNFPEKLLFSYHGMPQITHKKGDPYYDQCLETTQLIKNALNERGEQWRNLEIITTFQSRFGTQKWLQPYTSATLQKLAKQGIKKVAIACPGFSADCLETLEEIEEENKEVFSKFGGQEYHYIPALNADVAHVQLMVNLIEHAALGM